MKRIFSAALFSVTFAFTSLLWAGGEPNAEQFKAIEAKAQDMDHTTVGMAYEEHFTEVLQARMGEAIRSCAGRTKPPFEIDLVFVISGDGKIEHIFADPGSPVAQCVAGKLERERLPAPPHADWMQLVNINIHE